MKYTLEIFNPIPGKGLGREYLARPDVMDEHNYVELGLIVRDETGRAVNDQEVTVKTDDPKQDVVLKGTGDIRKFKGGSNPGVTPFYAFRYEILTDGKHTITFTCGKVSAHTTLNAGKDDRPEPPAPPIEEAKVDDLEEEDKDKKHHGN